MFSSANVSCNCPEPWDKPQIMHGRACAKLIREKTWRNRQVFNAPAAPTHTSPRPRQHRPTCAGSHTGNPPANTELLFEKQDHPQKYMLSQRVMTEDCRPWNPLYSSAASWTLSVNGTNSNSRSEGLISSCSKM